MKRFFLFGFGLAGMSAVALFSAALLLDTPNEAPPSDGPGYVTRSMDVPHRDGPVTVHVWYPAAEGGSAEWIGRNGLFLGSAVRRDASALPGPHPVAFMAHGSGGSGPRMGWLANALVADGWVVVTPDHPGTTSGDSTPQATVRIWNRTEDFAALNADLAALLPPGLTAGDTRAAVGFSLGGHTALALGGVRVSAEAFAADCATRSDFDCGWLQRGGVDLSMLDASRYDADLSLPRIDAVAAIDPALGAAMTADSLESTTQPVLLINLGMPAPRAMQADRVADGLPNASFEQIAGTGHFAMLPECSPLGRIVLGLATRADENICAEYDAPRRQVQDEVAGQIVAFLSPLR